MAKLAKEKKAMLDKMMQDQIRDAACEVIDEHGLDKMTMDKVAAAAGVAKGTLYNYFKDKKELFTYIVDSLMEPLDKKIADLANSPNEPLEKLKEIAKNVLNTFSENGKIFYLIHQAREKNLLKNRKPFRKREMVLNSINAIVAEGIEKGVFKDLNPKITAEIFLGMIMSINISKIHSPVIRPVDEDLEIIMTVFTGGVLKLNE